MNCIIPMIKNHLNIARGAQECKGLPVITINRHRLKSLVIYIYNTHTFDSTKEKDIYI